jgi:hypothetical protein
VLLAALLLLLALAPCALCCVLVCLIHPRRGRLSRVIGNISIHVVVACLASLVKRHLMILIARVRIA